MPRLEVNKTYKMWIGGAFVRSESGYSTVHSQGDKFVANTCLASRKDLRDAVVAARNAFGGWSGRTAYNRGQILYRMAEMLEARIDEVAEMLMIDDGISKSASEKLLQEFVDNLVHYAGWADKFQAVLGSVNPVAASYFNFTVPEPVGVVVAANSIFDFAPILCGGSTCILVEEARPLTASVFAEVWATSDIPGGAVNILTGVLKDVMPHAAAHMDVNALWVSAEGAEKLKDAATENLKRVRVKKFPVTGVGPIEDFLEMKTVWHPMGL